MSGELVQVDLAQVGRDLKGLDRRFATSIRASIRKATRESGSSVLNAIRQGASWSSRIPGATQVRASFSARGAGVVVSTSRRRAPDARPYESGSKGAPDGVLRHPVFGNRNVWVEQPTRPFFGPATKAAESGIVARMNEAVSQALRDSGFKE